VNKPLQPVAKSIFLNVVFRQRELSRVCSGLKSWFCKGTEDEHNDRFSITWPFKNSAKSS